MPAFVGNWELVMTSVLDRNAKLRRKKVALALSEAGYPISPATLATKATRGGGPPYQLFGRIPLYERGRALDWANSRLTSPRSSTSGTDLPEAAEPNARDSGEKTKDGGLNVDGRSCRRHT